MAFSTIINCDVHSVSAGTGENYQKLLKTKNKYMRKCEVYDEDYRYTYSYDIMSLCQHFIWDQETDSNTAPEGHYVHVEQGLSWETTQSVTLTANFGGKVGLAEVWEINGSLGFSYMNGGSTTKTTAQSYSTYVKQGMPYGEYYYAAVGYFDIYVIKDYYLSGASWSLASTERYYEYTKKNAVIKWVRQDL